jgi:DNA-binding PadR family transcriptional regulator
VTSSYVLRSYVVRSTMRCMRTRPDVFDHGTPSSRRRSNDPPILILMSLAGGAKHGHALLKDIEEFAGVKLGPGALYGAITRLEERGLIEPLESDDRRRPYRITTAGSEALADSVAQMRELVRVGQARLKMVPTPRPRMA